jgi:hypothetical protein
MEHKVNDFPQFRKLSNEKAFYHIINNETFTEVQLMGQKRFLHHVKAVQYPEKLRIMDMLSCTEPFEECSSQEYFEQEIQVL